MPTCPWIAKAKQSYLEQGLTAPIVISERTAEGLKKTHLSQTLLNGNNITMVSCVLSEIQLRRGLPCGHASADDLCCQTVIHTRQQLVPGGEGPETAEVKTATAAS